jgi:hypothetical protein
MISTNVALQEKWTPVLDHSSMEPIKDNYRRTVIAQLLENQEKATMSEHDQGGSLFSLQEADQSTNTGTTSIGAVGFTNTGPDNRKGYDPILISLVRRAAPQLIAFDVCGVQTMTGPSGLIFFMKSNYVNPGDHSLETTPEALHDEPDSRFSTVADADNPASGAHSGADDQAVAPVADPFQTDYSTGTGDAADPPVMESAGATSATNFREMSFSIESTTVLAKARALKAEFTTELAHDLKAIHGLDAETELANILSTEILAEINREVIRTINLSATAGAADNVATPGRYDLAVDSNGRWSVEKFKGLHFQLEREANAIAVNTRRGRGNWIIASADVVAALSMTGQLDTGIDKGGIGTGGLSADGITGNTFVGTLNGRYKVYVDPYFVAEGGTGRQYVTVGYKGSSPYDAGLFYCPYVPLAMVKATGENTFQPKIGFKTRYGMKENPYQPALGGSDNNYFRIIDVRNLM